MEMEKSKMQLKCGLLPERHCLRAAETFGMLVNGIAAAERQSRESMIKPKE